MILEKAIMPELLPTTDGICGTHLIDATPLAQLTNDSVLIV